MPPPALPRLIFLIPFLGAPLRVQRLAQAPTTEQPALMTFPGGRKSRTLEIISLVLMPPTTLTIVHACGWEWEIVFDKYEEEMDKKHKGIQKLNDERLLFLAKDLIKIGLGFTETKDKAIEKFKNQRVLPLVEDLIQVGHMINNDFDAMEMERLEFLELKTKRKRDFVLAAGQDSGTVGIATSSFQESFRSKSEEYLSKLSGEWRGHWSHLQAQRFDPTLWRDVESNTYQGKVFSKTTVKASEKQLKNEVEMCQKKLEAEKERVKATTMYEMKLEAEKELAKEKEMYRMTLEAAKEMYQTSLKILVWFIFGVYVTRTVRKFVARRWFPILDPIGVGRDDEGEVEPSQCCICLDKVVTRFIVPCGHSVLCNDCNLNDDDPCPICRQQISLVSRIYES